MLEIKRPLKIFISYASQDKPVVQEFSRRLASEGWIDPWVDEKKLLPGQDWRTKIEEAVETSDIVIICLSSNSVSKEGFVQKELRYAREIAFEKPDETIFLIPLRLDDCIVPRGLRFYQWGDYFGEKIEDTYIALLEALKIRHEQKLKLEEVERARQEKERREHEATEKVAREKAERETAERIAIEKAEREAAEKSKWEKVEREVAEKAAREKEKRESIEKIERESVPSKSEQKATTRTTTGKFAFGTISVFGIVVVCIIGLIIASSIISSLGSNSPPINAEPTSTSSAPIDLPETYTVVIRYISAAVPSSRINDLVMRLQGLGYSVGLDDSIIAEKGWVENAIYYGHPDCLNAIDNIKSRIADIADIRALNPVRFETFDTEYTSRNIVIIFVDSSLFTP